MTRVRRIEGARGGWLKDYDESDPPPGRGRPKAQRPAQGVSSCDLADVKRVQAGVERVLALRWPEMDAGRRQGLAHRLAHEVLALRAVRTVPLQRVSDPSRSGPKPRAADMAFAATVRGVTESEGIRLPQWRNGRAQCDDLDVLCRELLAVDGQKWAPMSSRAAGDLSPEGWRG